MQNKRSLFHNSLLSLINKNKRGISAIVATVMIILITVAAIGILWAAIIPMIQTNLDFSSLQGRVSVLDKGYTAYDSSQNIASVQVKRDVDEGVMDRIKITFEVGGNSYSSSVIAPESGGTRVYTFDMAGIGEPDSVSVAPIFAVGNKEKEGEITSTVEIPKSRTSESVGVVYDIGEEYFGDSSCLEILNSGGSTGDGVYTIDLDGKDGEDPFEVYCDMTTDSGGWTLLDNFVSSNSGDVDPYGAAIGNSNIRNSGDLTNSGYDKYLTNIETTVYTRTDGYLQMFYSGSLIGYIEKTLPDYANEVYVKWGNWYSGSSTLKVGDSIVSTLSGNYGASVYQGRYNSGDKIRFEEGGIFWVGEIWVR